MTNANSSIALIPSSQFKWTAQVQFMETLSTRDDAIRYASQRGCNLIVKYERRPGPQFDVLQDPNLVCTSEDTCETVETVPTFVEPEFTGWSKLMLRSVFGIARRRGAAGSTSQREKAIPAVRSQALAAK
jgi:hypothetical protein